MKPKPLASLNHFTVPVVFTMNLLSAAARSGDSCSLQANNSLTRGLETVLQGGTFRAFLVGSGPRSAPAKQRPQQVRRQGGGRFDTPLCAVISYDGGLTLAKKRSSLREARAESDEGIDAGESFCREPRF